MRCSAHDSRFRSEGLELAELAFRGSLGLGAEFDDGPRSRPRSVKSSRVTLLAFRATLANDDEPDDDADRCG